MNDFQDKTMPFVCAAKLLSFEDGIRASAETQRISEFGVTLRLLEDIELPKRVAILIPGYRINIGCQVVWRHRDQVGMRFDRKIELPATDRRDDDKAAAAG